MKNSLVKIVSVCFILLLLCTFSYADVALTSDGRVPGKPFEYLQQQIDSNKQAIENIELTPGPAGPQGPPGPQGEPGPAGENMAAGQQCNEGAYVTGFTEAGTIICSDESPGPSTTKSVFITSSIHNGNIGGISGADAICNNLASNAGLPGTYRAWISNDEVYPLMTFTKTNEQYTLVDGTVVCENWSALINTIAFDFSNPINMTEQGDLISDHYEVWTGTNPYGSNQHSDFTIIESCNGWSTSDDSTQAVYGEAASLNWIWTYGFYDTCNQQKRLYCFEQ